ncbi:hypothetical protein ACS0TY_036917 [Phlomoides rotata]
MFSTFFIKTRDSPKLADLNSTPSAAVDGEGILEKLLFLVLDKSYYRILQPFGKLATFDLNLFWEEFKPLQLKSKIPSGDTMKHIVKIMTLVVVLTAIWISLLQTSVLPKSYTWLLPLYCIVSLGCYGLLMVGVGLMRFPTCPHEAILLQEDVIEAKDFLKGKGVDIGED